MFSMNVYEKNGTQTVTAEGTYGVYKEKKLKVLVNGTVKEKTYYIKSGTQTISPDIETVEYMETTIGPLKKSTINEAFGLDPNAWYVEPSIENATESGVKNSVAVMQMSSFYKSVLEDMGISLYGGSVGEGVPGVIYTVSEEYLRQIVPNIPECSENRMYLLRVGAALSAPEHHVGYFWGGKTRTRGWESSWGELRMVSGRGTGNQRPGEYWPFGLDCSGFVAWTYNTTFGDDTLFVGTETLKGNSVTRKITEEELLPGDIGVRGSYDSDGNWAGHTGIFVGYNEKGEQMWLHCEGVKNGVTINAQRFKYYRRAIASENSGNLEGFGQELINEQYSYPEGANLMQ
jgi:hypothetical protein